MGSNKCIFLITEQWGSVLFLLLIRNHIKGNNRNLKVCSPPANCPSPAAPAWLKATVSRGEWPKWCEMMSAPFWFSFMLPLTGLDGSRSAHKSAQLLKLLYHLGQQHSLFPREMSESIKNKPILSPPGSGGPHKSRLLHWVSPPTLHSESPLSSKHVSSVPRGWFGSVWKFYTLSNSWNSLGFSNSRLWYWFLALSQF